MNNKYIFFILLIFSKLVATTCCDGTYSSSTGRGTCSHHGGICNNNGYIYNNNPSVPNGLSINCINNQNIKLDWNNATNAIFYEVYYSPNCDYSYTYIDNTSYSNYTIFSETTCNICFKVKACNYSSCSNFSNIVQGKNITIFNYYSSEINDIKGNIIEFDNRICRLYGIKIPKASYSSELYNNAKMCQINEDIIKESGEEAKNFINNVIKNQNLEINITGKDNNRDICNIKFNKNINLSELLIKEGYAVIWEKDIKNKDLLIKYKEFQENAKNNLKGLWNNSYNVMNCLSNNESIFDNNKEFLFYDMVVSSFNLENGYKKINFNYNNNNNNFIIRNNSDFKLNKDNINIYDITNNIYIYSNRKIYIINNSPLTKISHEFNSSIDNNNTLEYSQINNKNIIKYYINNIFQFSINYFQNSLINIKHKNNSKFKNDINITTDSKIWVDNKNDIKSLFIITKSLTNIKF